jgi:polyhydroxyalkanoate synthesis repressor PhaR
LRRTREDFAPQDALRGRVIEAEPVAEPVADASGPTASSDVSQPDPVVIKKYANRRLYNTSSSAYVTLDHLSEMVRDGVDFVVLDAKTDEDITRSVLTQIIVEQESRGQNLLPVEFLRRLIRFYGEPMQGFLPAYLNMSMESFTKAQDQMRENFSRAFGASTPMAAFEEQTQRNMAMFQQAMKMWAPFAHNVPGMAQMQSAMNAQTTPRAEPTEEARDDDVDALRKQMEAMQKQLDAIARGKS